MYMSGSYANDAFAFKVQSTRRYKKGEEHVLPNLPLWCGRICVDDSEYLYDIVRNHSSV